VTTTNDPIEEINFEFENKYTIPKDDDLSWPNSNFDGLEPGSDRFEESTEDAQGNWGISPVNDSNTSTSSTKRTLSPHISANDDDSDCTSTSSAAKKTKLG
jgi:hypothetical protein